MDTVWLNHYLRADDFESDRISTVKKSRNIYKSGELRELATCTKIISVEIMLKATSNFIIFLIFVNFDNNKKQNELFGL